MLAEIEHTCSRVAIIQRGRIVAQGTKAELEAEAGRRGELEIRATGAGDRLAGALAARRLAPRREAGSDVCVVFLPEGQASPELLAALLRDGVPVDSFRPLTRSLHDIFLDLTRDAAP